MDRTVLEAKRYGCYCCKASSSLLEAARKMVQEDISALGVRDEDEYLVGIITRTDLLKAHLAYEDWAEQPVEEFMSTDLVTVTPGTTLREVAKLMVEHHIHRVVAVQEEAGKLRPISVISDSDLVYHLVREA
jgi:CBS domain-containing protein